MSLVSIRLKLTIPCVLNCLITPVSCGVVSSRLMVIGRAKVFVRRGSHL